MTNRPIRSVHVFENGMVMVFGHDGQQIPEYQGHKNEMLPAIRAVYSGPISAAQWNDDGPAIIGELVESHERIHP